MENYKNADFTTLRPESFVETGCNAQHTQADRKETFRSQSFEGQKASWNPLHRFHLNMET